MRTNAFCFSVAIVAATAGCDGSAAPPSGTVGTTSVGAGNHAGVGSPDTPGGDGTSGGGDGSSGGGSGGGSGNGGGTVGRDCPTQVTWLASGTHIPGPLAVDATYVYWADLRSGYASVHRVPKSGGADTVLTSDGINLNADIYNLRGLAVDADGVYWVTWSYDHDGGTESSLYAYRFADGITTTLFSGSGTTDLLVDNHTLYFSNDSRGLMSQPTRGGLSTVLATLDAGKLAIDPTNYFVTNDTGLYRISRTTNAVTQLANAFTYYSAVATDPNSAYVADRDGAMWAVDAPMQTPRVLHAAHFDGVGYQFVRRAGNQLYFNSDQGLARIATDGSGFTVLDPQLANDAIVDGDTIYYSQDDEVDALCR